MMIREGVTTHHQDKLLREQKLKEAEAALRITWGLQKKNHASYNLAKALQYWQQTGRTAPQMEKLFKGFLETALRGCDVSVKQAFQGRSQVWGRS